MEYLSEHEAGREDVPDGHFVVAVNIWSKPPNQRVDRYTPYVDQFSSSKLSILRSDRPDEQPVTVPVKAEGIAMKPDRVIVGRVDLCVAILHGCECSSDFHDDSFARHTRDLRLEASHSLLETLAGRTVKQLRMVGEQLLTKKEKILSPFSGAHGPGSLSTAGPGQYKNGARPDQEMPHNGSASEKVYQDELEFRYDTRTGPMV